MSPACSQPHHDVDVELYSAPQEAFPRTRDTPCPFYSDEEVTKGRSCFKVLKGQGAKYKCRTRMGMSSDSGKVFIAPCSPDSPREESARCAKYNSAKSCVGLRYRVYPLL